MNKEIYEITAKTEKTTYTENEIKNLALNDADKTIIEELLYERDFAKTIPLTNIISETTDDLINEFAEKHNIEDDIAIEFLILKGIKAFYNE